MKAQVFNLSGQACSEIELSDHVFGLKSRSDILARVVRWQLAKRRSGNHAIKERGDVAGSTKKIVKQKGSGGARHGSRRGAQFRGGGIIFGPVVRDHGFDLPKKVRKLGLRMALSDKMMSGSVKVVQNFELPDSKTKTALKMVEDMGMKSSKVLFIDANQIAQSSSCAIANIIGLDALPQIGANVYDIVRKDQLVLTVDAVRALEERLK